MRAQSAQDPAPVAVAAFFTAEIVTATDPSTAPAAASGAGGATTAPLAPGRAGGADAGRQRVGVRTIPTAPNFPRAATFPPALNNFIAPRRDT